LKILVDYIRTSVEILLNMRIDKSQVQSLAKSIGVNANHPQAKIGGPGSMLIKNGQIPAGLITDRGADKYNNLVGNGISSSLASEDGQISVD
jgi:hypothetical protein